MKKNTFLKIFFTASLITSSSLAFSQENCPVVTHDFSNIVVNVEPIQFDYSKTSKEIQQIGNKTDISNKSHLLGLYNSQKQLFINPLLKSSKLASATQWCGAFATVSFTLKSNPIIYISKEAQQYQCTLNRVKEHEMTHHTFEIKAFSQAKSSITSILQKYYTNNVIFTDNAQASQIIKQKNTMAMEEINKFLKSISLPLHESIDTESNYKRESAICSEQENMLLSKTLLTNR